MSCADLPVLVGMGAVASCTFPEWRACGGLRRPCLRTSVLGPVALIPHTLFKLATKALGLPTHVAVFGLRPSSDARHFKGAHECIFVMPKPYARRVGAAEDLEVCFQIVSRGYAGITSSRLDEECSESFDEPG